jgi:hypothetical protein
MHLETALVCGPKTFMGTNILRITVMGPLCLLRCNIRTYICINIYTYIHIPWESRKILPDRIIKVLPEQPKKENAEKWYIQINGPIFFLFLSRKVFNIRIPRYTLNV